MTIKRIVTFAAATALSVGLLAAGPAIAAGERGATGAALAQGGVFRGSYTLAQFEQLTGVRMLKTFGSRTWYSHFRSRPTLARDGYNFFINRNNGKIVFRSLSGAPSPFTFDSVFAEVGSRSRRDVGFNWLTPRTPVIAGFPRGPIAVSLN